MRRYTDLVAKGATPVLNLDNAQDPGRHLRGAIKADQAQLENLKVQLSYCTIRAPISGRISQAAVKVGNFVRQRRYRPIATINQIAPIYVSFTVPQRSLPDIRAAMAPRAATVEAHRSGRKPVGQRRGHDDREHRRPGHRHGDGARHDAERR